VVNLHRRYREIDPTTPDLDQMTLMTLMAQRAEA
jgi:hypothetical protein